MNKEEVQNETTDHWQITESHPDIKCQVFSQRPLYHEHSLCDSCRTATEPRLHFKVPSHHMTLVFILTTSNSRKHLPPIRLLQLLTCIKETSHLFYFFILTVKAGIGNALAGRRQGGRHLNDLISSHIGLVWLRRGEEMRQASFRAPQRPLEPQSGVFGWIFKINRPLSLSEEQ